jgi:rhodanese-related sulfurtransferase
MRIENLIKESCSINLTRKEAKIHIRPIQKYANWLLIVVSSGFLSLSGCTPLDLSSISAKQAATMLAENKAIIVDVREGIEWQAGHIQGAKHIPLPIIEHRLKELSQYQNTHIILQCRSGKRSAKATDKLLKAGFKNVYNLTGGIVAWEKAGLPITQ